MAQYYEDNKITYQQLIMAQIKIIQNIASKELRDGTKSISNLMGQQVIEAEDTRHSFLQSIRMFGSLLKPYFNKDTGDNFETYCKLYDMELINAFQDEDFKKEIITLFGEIDKIQKDDKLLSRANIYFLNFKINQGWTMFMDLVQLFKDNDFLSSESYSEGGDDDSLEAVDDTEDD